ncbi:hypothetical protein [Glycomyces salinus]|uniref:hypothetical protein n=1 Tax=Glycomyces salinus TaxID=980294 RepID=UPI0018ED0266|nr:hypothetical protein [Glycomyces salinus]
MTTRHGSTPPVSRAQITMLAISSGAERMYTGVLLANPMISIVTASPIGTPATRLITRGANRTRTAKAFTP